MAFKCAFYISKCIWLVHKPSTKCHLGWANERGSTLKLNPKTKLDYKPTSLPTYNLPTCDLPTYLIN